MPRGLKPADDPNWGKYTYDPELKTYVLSAQDAEEITAFRKLIDRLLEKVDEDDRALPQIRRLAAGWRAELMSAAQLRKVYDLIVLEESERG